MPWTHSVFFFFLNTFVLTGAAFCRLRLWGKFFSQLHHQPSLPASHVFFSVCTYQFIIPLWLSASLDLFSLRLHLESLSDHKLRRSFYTYIYIKLGVSNSKCLRFFPWCCRPTKCFHFYFYRTYFFKFVQYAACCVFLLLFCLVPNDTNPVVISIPPVFPATFWCWTGGCSGPKTLSTLVCFSCRLHWKGTLVCMPYFHKMLNTIKF